MKFSTELIISITIQLISIGIFVGVNQTTLNFMQEQIKDLKEEMRKYNNVLTRLALVENSSNACHKRLDNLTHS